MIIWEPQSPQFQVGDPVRAVAFVNCFGRLVNETLGLTVESVQLITSDVSHDTMKPYYRVLARAADGFGCVEGAERFFAISRKP